MLLTGRGLSFDNFIDEFGHSLFGEIDEFGFYIDSGEEQTFDLLAESTSDVSITFTVSSTTETVSESTSDVSITFTLESSTIDSILAESVSYTSFLFTISSILSILAESTSEAITDLQTQEIGYTSLLAESTSEIEASSSFNPTTSILAESTSEAITTLTPILTISVLAESISESIADISTQDIGYIEILLAESTSGAITTSLFGATFNVLAVSLSSALSSLATLFSTTNLVALSSSSFYIEITPELVGYLGLFPCNSLSSLGLDIFTYDVVITDPITEEGFCVSEYLTEFGELVLCPLTENALTASSKYVFYTIYTGLHINASNSSFARTKVRYQHFQYPYIIIFDSNYNLISVEDIVTGKFIQVKDNNKFTLDIDV